MKLSDLGELVLLTVYLDEQDAPKANEHGEVYSAMGRVKALVEVLRGQTKAAYENLYECETRWLDAKRKYEELLLATEAK